MSTFRNINEDHNKIIEDLYSREQVSEEEITPWRIKAICATLDIPNSKSITTLQPGWHQLFCLPTVGTSKLSADGYEDDFAPPKPYIARMWGGSKLSWNIDSKTSKPFKISIGDKIRKKTSIEKATFKEGKKSGNLLILDVVNQYSRVADNEDFLKDTVSMIYRTKAFDKKDIVKENSTPLHVHQQDFSEIICEPSSNPTKWTRTLVASPVLLFRYSALTFNAHMIHYDQNYSVNEGFNNTLVHGPLQAQLLLDHINRIFPEKNITQFSYRGLFLISFNLFFTLFSNQLIFFLIALAPLENKESFNLVAEKVSEEQIKVFVESNGTVTMDGSVNLI